MALIVHQKALQMIQQIKPLIDRIARHDRALADQLRRSASSVRSPMNSREARIRTNARAVEARFLTLSEDGLAGFARDRPPARNIGEAAYSRGANQGARFDDAAGSASETRSALKVAAAWGYVDAARCRAVDAKLDEILAMLWVLTHRRKTG